MQYMFSLDMTGEDTAKTGGTFLIEKQADPSAVWARPSDPHTEWGAGEVKAESLKGSLLNDLHLAVCLRRATDTGWVVRTNPYEGGSDHTAFTNAGIPVAAQLALHRSLLPHQSGHARQDERGRDGTSASRSRRPRGSWPRPTSATRWPSSSSSVGRRARGWRSSASRGRSS